MLWLIALAVIAIVAFLLWPKIKTAIPGEPKPAASGTGRGRGGNATIPVVATKAHRGNIQIFYTGLGAVTPIYTVNVKSRVDGELVQVVYKEGELVKKGDLLVQIDPRPYQVALDQAEGQLSKDQATLKNARVDLERYRVLLAQEAVPEQQYVTQQATVTQDEGVIQSDVAAVNGAKLNLVYAHITSPINGVVGLRLVDPGNIVHATDTNPLLVITQVDPISVIFTLPEDQLAPVLEKLHAGQKLPAQAWDRDLTRKIEDGTLSTIDNEIDPTTGTLRLRAVFSNPSFHLFPSQFVNVRLLVDTHRNVTLVENAAIQRNNQSTYVWLVNQDSTVTLRDVKTEASEGDETEIVSGLNPGDEVVMVGVDKLQNGSKVNAQVEQPPPPQPVPAPAAPKQQPVTGNTASPSGTAASPSRSGKAPGKSAAAVK